ncbi:MAG TPA: glucokinase [Gemmatimonadales bacterium]|nr:glucokinase [Gemmatimonadales bacterium]
MNVLAGDVGGTNARLALVEMADGRAIIREQRTYPSRAYAGLAAIVRTFYAETGARPERACIGLPCPAAEDECRAANLPWRVDAGTLGREIAVGSTALINDFTAMGHGIALLGDDDVETLQVGEPKARAPIGLIGAGTGLGVGFLTWRGDHYEVHGSEGGHIGFAPRGERQAGLGRSLEHAFGRVSSERVVSGPGIVETYKYLATAGAGAAPENPTVRAEIDRGEPAAVIVRHGVAGTDALCRETLDLFVDALGAAAGDLALTVLARAGIYIGGGIAPRIVAHIREGGLLRAFRDKGRLSEFLARVPVRVILNPHVGLLGAAAVAARLP